MKNIFIVFLCLNCFFHCYGQFGFIENRGQVRNQYDLPNPKVLFVLPLKGMNVLLSADGFSYDVFETKSSFSDSNIQRSKNYQRDILPDFVSRNLRVHRVDVLFKNMSSDMVINPEIATSQIELAYYGSGIPDVGIHGVKNFSKIIYKNVYKGVDVEFIASKEKGFEYNFVLHGSHDLSKIALEYQGQLNLRLQENALFIDLTTNDIIESIPRSYYTQSEQEIEVQMNLNYNLLTFKSPLALNNNSVTIDPTPNLVYATYFGGTGQELVEDSAIDSQGNVYITGSTSSTQSIATSGSFQSVISGTYDCFISKVNSNNQLEWSTYFGGTGDDYMNSISIKDDVLMLCGLTFSPMGLASLGAFQEGLYGFNNGFVARFDSNGNRIWSSYCGVDDEILISSVILNNGNYVAIGISRSDSLPFSVNAFQSNLNGMSDGFITEWSANGQLLYCSFLGGESFDGLYDLKESEAGNIWMTGITNSETGISMANSLQSEFGGGLGDCFIVQFNSDFELIYSTYFGDLGDEAYPSLQIGNGSIVISGRTSDGSQLVTDDATQLSNNGFTDTFFAFFNPQNDLEYCTLFGGQSYESETEILFLDNELYFVGQTESTENIATPGSFMPFFPDANLTSQQKIMFGKFGSSHQLLWCSYFGDYKYEGAGSLHISNGRFIITGNTRFTDDLAIEFQAPFSTPDAFQLTNAGSDDAFIAIFDGYTGLPEINNNWEINEIFVYPNSVRNQLNINLPLILQDQDLLISIYDAGGKKCSEQRINHAAANETLYFSEWSSGIYSLQITSEDGIQINSTISRE
jgi:hypothetical protein